MVGQMFLSAVVSHKLPTNTIRALKVEGVSYEYYFVHFTEYSF